MAKKQKQPPAATLDDVLTALTRLHAAIEALGSKPKTEEAAESKAVARLGHYEFKESDLPKELGLRRALATVLLKLNNNDGLLVVDFDDWLGSTLHAWLEELAGEYFTIHRLSVDENKFALIDNHHTGALNLSNLAEEHMNEDEEWVKP